MFRRVVMRCNAAGAAAASTPAGGRTTAPGGNAADTMEGSFESTGSESTYTPRSVSRSNTWYAQDTSLFGRVRNRYRKEMKLGWNSPMVLAGYFGAIVYVVYRLFHGYIKPWKLQQAEREFHLKVPFVDSHNAAFGIQPARVVHEEPGTVMGEIDIDRPQIVAREPLETAKDPTEMVVMQMREFDPQSGKDIFLRSLHCMPADRTDAGAAGTDRHGKARGGMHQRIAQQSEPNAIESKPSSASSSSTAVGGAKSATTSDSGNSIWSRIFGLAPSKSSTGGSGTGRNSTKVQTPESEEREQTRRLGESLIHGIVRCTAIGPRGNCIANPSMIEQEYARKMLTALGAVHMLRHPRHNTAPFRTSQAIEIKADVLCLGLGGGGALPSFLNRHMPHYIIDVVEGDGALLRLARNFLGFREGSGLHVALTDPAEFVRRSINTDVGKGRYDAVFVDCIDEKGRVPQHLTRLEFLSNLRQTLSDRAVACTVLPNFDEHHFTSVVANWRMAFEGRSVLLLHCKSSPHTVLITFMDSAGKGIQRFGSVQSYIDYREVCKSLLSHHGSKLPFDIIEEIQADSFQQILPGQRFTYRRVNTAEERKKVLREDRGYDK